MNRAMQLKDRIKNLANQYHVRAQAVLQDFMLERLLERISASKYQDRLILKGGMLIASMVGINNRTTMDMDTTLRGYPLTAGMVSKAISEICSIAVQDNVTFAFDNVEPIRDEDEYGGYRAHIMARYESITVPLKIDITCGDIITPNAIHYTFHSSFEDKSIQVWAYNIETILAEKVETVLRRSVLNTRPRDFYDVYILTKKYHKEIDRALLKVALTATSNKRGSLAALEQWQTILPMVRGDKTMQERWKRYTVDNYYAEGINFDEALDALNDLLLQ
jgi:predicted nucleotidyltransferase component of viral defense system